jgi:hypothetical protein
MTPLLEHGSLAVPMEQRLSRYMLLVTCYVAYLGRAAHQAVLAVLVVLPECPGGGLPEVAGRLVRHATQQPQDALVCDKVLQVMTLLRIIMSKHVLWLARSSTAPASTCHTAEAVVIACCRGDVYSRHVVYIWIRAPSLL